MNVRVMRAHSKNGRIQLPPRRIRMPSTKLSVYSRAIPAMSRTPQTETSVGTLPAARCSGRAPADPRWWQKAGSGRSPHG